MKTPSDYIARTRAVVPFLILALALALAAVGEGEVTSSIKLLPVGQ